jgi:hypothetical protein
MEQKLKPHLHYYQTWLASRNLIEKPKMNNIAPGPNVAAMILFYKPPQLALPSEVQIDSNRVSQAIRHNTKAFDSKINRVFKKMSESDESHKIYISNMKSATRFIIEAYKGKERRTGEPKYIHSMRVFLNGLQEGNQADASQSSLVYTSLLARILHDAKEDVKEFSIRFVEEGVGRNKYELDFKGSNSSSYLDLTPNEKELLEMQLTALSFDSGPEGRGTENQIQNLLEVTESIYETFGPLAAYLTLRIKIDDRIDNSSTYYRNKHVNTKEGLNRKLAETEKYFREVEHRAHLYHEQYIAQDKHTRDSLHPSRRSAVKLCADLRAHGGYEKLFGLQISSALLGENESEEDDLLHEFLIPAHT